MYKLILMSFDGEYQRERPEFETVQDAWEYANDLGSKWFFYPFPFVVSESGKTIIASALPFGEGEGRRVKTIQRIFNKASQKPEAQNMDADRFGWFAMVS